MALKLSTDHLEEERENTPAGARLYSLREVADILDVAPERIRAWVTAGLIQPCDRFGEWEFDFRQVTAAKTMCDLARSGVSVNKIRKQLESLRESAGAEEDPAPTLPLIEREGRLLIRIEDGNLAAADGQLHLDFLPDTPLPPMRLMATPQTAADWHDQAIQQEQDGELQSALESYRNALQVGGPDARVCFDLAFLLERIGDHAAAIERYMQAVELDRDFADAWNNLGVLLGHDRPLAACTAFRRALAAEPFNLRANYNLADTLDELGRPDEALPHWRAYLQVDAQSQWAEHARRRISAISSVKA